MCYQAPTRRESSKNKWRMTRESCHRPSSATGLTCLRASLSGRAPRGGSGAGCAGAAPRRRRRPTAPALRTTGMRSCRAGGARASARRGLPRVCPRVPARVPPPIGPPRRRGCQCHLRRGVRIQSPLLWVRSWRPPPPVRARWGRVRAAQRGRPRGPIRGCGAPPGPLGARRARPAAAPRAYIPAQQPPGAERAEQVERRGTGKGAPAAPGGAPSRQHPRNETASSHCFRNKLHRFPHREPCAWNHGKQPNYNSRVRSLPRGLCLQLGRLASMHMRSCGEEPPCRRGPKLCPNAAVLYRSPHPSYAHPPVPCGSPPAALPASATVQSMTPSPTTAQLTQHSLHFLCVHRHHTNPKQQCQERLTHVSACALDPKQRPQSSQPAGLPWSRCAPVAARARARPRAALAGGLLVVQPAGQLGRQCVAPERGRKLRGARRGIRPYWLQQPSEAGAAQATACMAPCMAVMHASYPTLYKNLSKQFQGHKCWVTVSDAIRMRACLKQDIDARHRPQSSP